MGFLKKDQIQVLAGKIPSGNYKLMGNNLVGTEFSYNLDLGLNVVGVQEQSVTTAKNYLLGALALPFLVVAPLLAVIGGVLAMNLGASHNVCAAVELKNGDKFIAVMPLDAYTVVKALASVNRGR